MKLKYILVVSLILAILTLGAVSASDDANNLTAVDDAAAISTDDVADTVSQVEEVDVVAEDTSDINEVLGEKEDMKYKTWCEDTIAGPNFDGEWGDFNGFIGVEVYEFSEEDITIYLDNEVVASFPAYEVQNEVYPHAIRLNDLEEKLSFGTHTARFVFAGDDYYNGFDIEKTFEYYYIKDNIANHEITKDSCFSLSLAKDAEGYLTLYIDGSEVFNGLTDDIREEDAENSRVMIFLNDLELESDLAFGEHRYKLRYHDGKYPDKEFEGMFTLGYEFYVDADYDDVIVYGLSQFFEITLPEGASAENLILVANGIEYPVDLDSNNEFAFSDFKIGENKLIFRYQDDKYPKMEIIFDFNVAAKILIPYGFTYGSDETILLRLPSDANGDLVVYKAIYDEESWEFTPTDEVIASSPLNNGVANISISDFKLGNHAILVKYTGDNYDVEDAYRVVQVVPKVIYKNYYWVDGENSISIESQEGNYIVDLVYEYYDDDYNYCTVVTNLHNGAITGKLSLNLPDKLNVTSYGYYGDGDGSKYYIKVQYLEDDEVVYDSGELYFFNVKADNPVWEMEVDFPTDAFKDNDMYWVIKNIPSSLYSGFANVYIDDIQVSRVGYDFEERFDYDNYVSSDVLSKLSLGVHTWKIVFEDSQEYFEDATKSGTFKLNWVDVPSEVVNGDDTIYFDTEDENATGYLTLLVDGNEYAVEFIQNGRASIDLDNLAIGEHTYEIIYSGDKNHEKLTQNGTFTVKMVFDVNVDDGDSMPLKESYVIEAELPEDATGNVLISIDGNNYTAEVINGTANMIVTGLTEGEHSFVVKYSGDSKYPSQEIKGNFEIEGYAVVAEFDDDGNLYAFSLVLPSDATGDLVVYLTGEDYRELKRVELKDGKARIPISELGLKFGIYYLAAMFEGEDYLPDVASEQYSILPEVNVTEKVIIGEDAKVEIDVGDATGNITIRVNGEEVAKEEIKDGKVIVTIPSDKLTLGENIVTLEYEGEDYLSDEIFHHFDMDADEYVSDEYIVNVEPKNLTIPEDFPTNGNGNVTLELPEGSSGNVTVYVDGKEVSKTPVSGGINTIPVSGLSTGDHNVEIKYTDDNGQEYSASKDVNVPKPEPKIDISTPIDSTNPEFSVNLPEDATGSLIVNVDGKSYTADLVNGKATISVPGLADGDYNVTVRYSGDKKYSGFTKNTNVVINTTPKKEDTPQPVPETEPAKKADKITLKLKKVKKVKRSAKKLVIKATLKINGKAVKGKKLKFKFNKIKYTAKTNKKGVAKIKVTKKVLKKLKAGKKVKIQVSYGKKTVKQKVKVKK